MISSKSDLEFVILTIRVFISFQIKKLFFFIKNGHFFRKKEIKNYLKKNKIRKLHLGYTRNISGFLNSQILGNIPIDITKKLPFLKEEIDLIFSSHLLEHIHKKEIDFFLYESFRVLKKNGINIIATPSLDKIIETCYLKKKNKKYLVDFSKKFYDDKLIDNSHILNLSFRAFGHRYIVDFNYMHSISKKIGYSSCREVSVDKVPDKLVKKYIKKYKSLRWFSETSIYILKK